MQEKPSEKLFFGHDLQFHPTVHIKFFVLFGGTKIEGQTFIFFSIFFFFLSDLFTSFNLLYYLNLILVKAGDELRTDTHGIEDVVNQHGGPDAICAVVTATSVFAPRVADDVPAGKTILKKCH